MVLLVIILWRGRVGRRYFHESSEFDKNSELFLWCDPLGPAFLEYFQEATASMAQESH